MYSANRLYIMDYLLIFLQGYFKNLGSLYGHQNLKYMLIQSK